MNVICTLCPNGCDVTADESGNVNGAMCSRGEYFAKNELVEPKRALTTTVRTSFGALPVIPVKTNDAIPKSKIESVMNIVNTIVVTEPLEVGDVVYKNIIDGVDLVCTLNMRRRLK